MNSTPPIYLDHNATTPVLPEVVDAMLPFLREHFGNPSSSHSFGQRTRHAIAHARDQVAQLLGCDADEIIFTSGGTEANNLAIRGVAEACPQRRHVVTTAIEHPATARPCTWLEQHGYRLTRIGVDADGITQLATTAAYVTDATVLITAMHSNNETGVLQPIRELATLAHAHGALLHTDAAQSIGKVPVHVRSLEVDLLSIAGHKLYAPKGIGALYVKRGTQLAPFMLGAGHEHGLRPGAGSAGRRSWGWAWRASWSAAISTLRRPGCESCATLYGNNWPPPCPGWPSTATTRSVCPIRSTCDSQFVRKPDTQTRPRHRGIHWLRMS